MLHALSGDEARSIRRFGYEGPICQLPNGVVEPTLTALGPPPWRDQLPGETRVLLYIGRKDPIKNLESLIAAWSAIEREPRRFDDWSLVIAGWGDPAYEARLGEVARAAGLRRFAMLGPLYADAKSRALQQADAFALVSHSEALPMAALEASSYGLPLLVTPACNLDAAVAQGAALQVDPAAESIAHGARLLMSMPPGERQAMGAQGRTLVKARYSWEGIAQRFERAYAWLLGASPRPEWVDIR